MLLNHAKHSVSDAQLLCNYGPSYTPTNKHFFFFCIFFWPQVEVTPSTLRFTVLNNDPAAPQDHCGRRFSHLFLFLFPTVHSGLGIRYFARSLFLSKWLILKSHCERFALIALSKRVT